MIDSFILISHFLLRCWKSNMELVLEFHKANSSWSNFKDYIEDTDVKSEPMTSVDTNVAILQTVTCTVGLPIGTTLI